jgi:hypothetical protein
LRVAYQIVKTKTSGWRVVKESFPEAMFKPRLISHVDREGWKLELDVPPRLSSLFIRYSVSHLQEKGNKTRKHSSNTMQVDPGFFEDRIQQEGI